MSDGWTDERLAEREREIVERGKQFLNDQERLRAAKGFVGALSEMAGLPVSPPADRATAGGASDPITSRKPRAHPERDPGQPKWNKTEARYAQHLELQKRAGTVLWWAFEGITLKLAPDTRYTPDFAVMNIGGRLECHEVKAMNKKTGKPRYEDDARVKIACAAEKFRPLRFVMVWPARNGEWDCKEF